MTGPEHFREGLRLLRQAKLATAAGIDDKTADVVIGLAALAQAEFAACTAMAAAEQALAMMAHYGTMLVGGTEDDAGARMDAWGSMITP